MKKKTISPKDCDDRFVLRWYELIAPAVFMITGLFLLFYGAYHKNYFDIIIGGSVCYSWSQSLRATEQRRQFDYLVRLIEQRTDEIREDIGLEE